jgi:hypothetical protein
MAVRIGFDERFRPEFGIAELPLDQHRALLGRTFLRPLQLIYDGPGGAVTLAIK